MEIIVKICAVAVLCAITALAIRQSTPELSAIIVITASVIIGTMIIGVASEIIGVINKLTEKIGYMGKFFTPLIKIVGISIISKLSADICKDCSANALSSCVELAGSLIAISLSVPLVLEVIKLISSI